VQSVIRFVGVLNAAIWLGATLFFTVAGGPVFFSDAMAAFLPRPHRARAAELMIEQLFVFQQVCGGIALVLLLAEYRRNARLLRKAATAVVAALFALSLLGGFWLQPHMHGLQQVRYSSRATATERQSAERQFGLLHGLSQVMNLFVLAALGFHLWYVSRPPETPRFQPGFRPAAPSDGTVPRML
jgi:hypothetical protein